MPIQTTNPPQPEESSRITPCKVYGRWLSRARMAGSVTDLVASSPARTDISPLRWRTSSKVSSAAPAPAWECRISNCSATTTLAWWSGRCSTGKTLLRGTRRVGRVPDHATHRTLPTRGGCHLRAAQHQQPDHVHTARVATYAVDAAQMVAKLYYKAHGSSYWRLLNRALADIGIHRPPPSEDRQRMLETVDRRITTII
jgi:hypothetical protein